MMWMLFQSKESWSSFSSRVLFNLFLWLWSSPIKHCIRWISQELGTDVNLYALVFGESVLNDAVMIPQLSWSLRFNCSWTLMFNVQVFGLGFRA
jgi:hypothetical protein